MKPDKRDVLAAINDLRSELELEPLSVIPCGKQGTPDDCPIARALSHPDEPARVGPVTWRTALRTCEWLPEVLSNFIRAFDRGEYPELIDEWQNYARYARELQKSRQTPRVW